jgi:RNase H-fold protein (predicted Holliday junction resolvase)
MFAPKRVLALDVRTNKIGFAVFEAPTSLLDWGVRSFEKSSKALRSSFADRLSVLLAFYDPVAIVIRIRSYQLPSHNRAQGKIMAIIKSELRRCSKRSVIITTKQVRRAFAKNGKISKHDIAVRVADRFQELSWKLPRRRKIYQSEPTAMLVFDAVANGMTYFHSHARSQSSTERES